MQSKFTKRSVSVLADNKHREPIFMYAAVKLLFVGLCFYSILSWLNLMILTPDSANYISAAQNLLQTGDMNVNVNWPSWSYELGSEIYSEYPPGFPLIITAFLFIIGDPTSTVALIQSIAIAFLYFSVYKLAQALKFSWIGTLSIGILLTVLPTFRVIYAHFWTETIFIAILILTLYISIQLMKLSNRNLWPTVYFLLFFASGIKYIGVFNIALLIPVLMYYRSKGERLVNFFLAGLCSILPVGIWFWRNIAFFGSISRSHFADIVPNKLTHEVSFLLFFSAVLMLSVYILVIVAPLQSRSVKEKSPIKIFVAYLLTFVLGMVVLSFVTTIDPPGHRLLSPMILAGMVAFIYALKQISDNILKAKFFNLIRYIAPILLIAGSLWIYKYPEEPSELRINRPVEELLWNGIKEQDFYRTASHFYSAYNFTHQIYSDKPQMIIWADAYNNSDIQARLPKIGESPFFVVDLNSSSKEYMDMIQSYEEMGYKFKVYLNPRLPNYLVLYQDH